MTAKKVSVDFFYDIVSPYTYIGFEVLMRYKTVWPSMQLNLKPFLLAGVMKGSNNRAPMYVPNKAVYMTRDLQRLSNYYGVPLKMPDNFVQIAIEKGTLKAQRFLVSTDIVGQGKLTEQVSRQLWWRLFQSHEDIHEVNSFKEAGQRAKLDDRQLEQILANIDSQATKDKLRANTDEALGHNAFGSPVMVAHLPTGPEMLFGSDRIEILGHLLGEQYRGPFPAQAKL